VALGGYVSKKKTGVRRISDSRLSRLWSHAVKVKYGRCPITGQTDGLQSHHIIPKGRQNRFCIRWNIRNGVPLSDAAHRMLHDGDIDVQKKLIEYVEDRGDKDYLMEIKNMLKHEFLQHIGMCESEYRKMLLDELKQIIVEYS